MPKRAVPSLLAAASMPRRGACRSASSRSRRFRRTSPVGVAAAMLGELAVVRARRPSAWLTTPSRDVELVRRLLPGSDAAPSSCARAVAAARRSTSQASTTLDEPPVTLMPSSRAILATTHWPPRTGVRLAARLASRAGGTAGRRRTSRRCRRAGRGRPGRGARAPAARRAPRRPAWPARCARPGPSRCGSSPASRRRRRRS